MKESKPSSEDLLRLYCACGAEDPQLVISADREPAYNDYFNFTLYYRTADNFWQKLGTALRYLRGWKHTEISYDVMLLNVTQVEEMVDVLQERLKKVKEQLKVKKEGLS